MTPDFWELLDKMLEELGEPAQDMDGYFAPDLCKKCRGKGCCQHFPCMNTPADFKFLTDSVITEDEKVRQMIEVLKTRIYSIDTAMGTDREYGPLNPTTKRPVWEKVEQGAGYLVVRARAKGRPIFDSQLLYPKPIRDYVCANWTFEKGCSLQPGEDEEYRRPFTGRMLKPFVIPTMSGEPYRRCTGMYDEDLLMMEWEKYQKILWRVYLELEKEGMV